MRRARERYRVYGEEEFFAEEGRLSTAAERDLQPGLRVGGCRARGARRLAGLAVLIGAVAAVFVVGAIDALLPVGGSRRRAVLSRVARVGVSGPTAPTHSLGKAQLQRGRARQSRRSRRIRRSGRVTLLRAQLAAGPQPATRSASSGSSGALDGRTSVDQPGPRPNRDDAARDRRSPGESIASRPAEIVDRDEGRHIVVATANDAASLSPREEFGFER
jgi:hypothetical protein